MAAYAKKGTQPITFTDGVIKVDSIPFSDINRDKTSGLIKAIKTQAAACIPPVFIKISILRPNRSPRIITIYLGSVLGKSKINNKYKEGVTNPCTSTLLSTKTCKSISNTNRNIFFNGSLMFYLFLNLALLLGIQIFYDIN